MSEQETGETLWQITLYNRENTRENSESFHNKERNKAFFNE